MVMVIPSLFGVRDGTAVPDRSDGRSRLVAASRANHPNSETGRAVFQCAAGGPRPTTSCNVTGLQVRPNPPALPKLFRTSNQAVDPQRSINEVGQLRQDRLGQAVPFAAAKQVATVATAIESTTASPMMAWPAQPPHANARTTSQKASSQKSDVSVRAISLDRPCRPIGPTIELFRPGGIVDLIRRELRQRALTSRKGSRSQAARGSVHRESEK